MQRWLILWIPLLVSFLAAGCGDDSGPTGSGPVRAVIAEGSDSLEAPLSAGQAFGIGVVFSLFQPGELEVNVDWTFASNTIYVFITRGQCRPQQFERNECDILVASRASTPKPRVLTMPNATAGEYTLVILNLGPGSESISYQIVLTTE